MRIHRRASAPKREYILRPFPVAKCSVFALWCLTNLVWAGAACTSKSGSGHHTTTCDAGYVAVDDACAKLCESDSGCPSGFICGAGTQTDICVTGHRTDAPVITGIDGDGTANNALGETAHHLAQSILVTGNHFEGVDVALLSPAGTHTDVTVTARSSQQLTVALPRTIVDEGTYTLVVHGGAGDSSQSFQIMRGEVGETGFPGATYITRAALYGTTNVADATTTAIMVDNPNNQISDNHHFPSGSATGVMLTAINRINHTFINSQAPGSWFSDPGGSTALAAALNDLTEDTFVLLASRGDVSAWLRNGGVETDLAILLKQFGAAPGVHLLGSSGTAEAFVLAGRKGIGVGNGVFVAGPASSSTSLTLVDNDVVGASTVNYGVCVKDNANCTIAAAHVTGRLTSAQLPLDTLSTVDTTQSQLSATQGQLTTHLSNESGLTGSIRRLNVAAAGANFTTAYADITSPPSNARDVALDGTTPSGVTAAAAQGGLNLTVFNRADMSFVSTTTYDTHTCPASGVTLNAAALVTALNALDNTKLAVLTSYGDWTGCFKTTTAPPAIPVTAGSGGGLFSVTGLTAPNPAPTETNLATALKRVGASSAVDIVGVGVITSIAGSPPTRTYGQGSAYLLIGIPGLGAGTGIERFTPSGYANVSALVQNGTPLGMGSTNALPTYSRANANCFAFQQNPLGAGANGTLNYEFDRTGNWCPDGTFVAGFKYIWNGATDGTATWGVVLTCCTNAYY